MNLLVLCIPVIFFINILQGMDNGVASAVLSADQAKKKLGHVFIKGSDDQRCFAFSADRAALLTLVREKLEQDSNVGTQENPLVIKEVTRKQLKKMHDLLSYGTAGHEDGWAVMETNDFADASIGELADIIKIAAILQTTPVCEFAKKAFIEKLKKDHLKDFESNDKFIESFQFPDAVNLTLGHRMIVDDLSLLRSVLTTVLTDNYPKSNVVLNFSNECLLAYGSMPDSKGFCDMWCVGLGKAAHIETPLPIINATLLRTPLVGTLTAEKCELWNMVQGASTGRIFTPTTAKFAVMTLSPDLRTLALAAGTEVVLQDLKSNTTKRLNFDSAGADLGHCAHLLFTCDGKMLIDIRSNGKIRFWSLATGTALLGEVHTKPIVKFHCTNEGRLVTADEDGKLCLWNCPLGRRLAQWGIGRALCFNSKGNEVVVASDARKEGSVFEIKEAQCNEVASEGDAALHNFPSEDKKFSYAHKMLQHGCYHPNDKIIATAMEDNSICLWDTDRNQIKLLARLVTEKPVINMSFNDDGSALVSADESGLLALWHYCDEQTREYLSNNINLAQGALLFKIIHALKNKQPLDFLANPYLKGLYGSLSVDLLTKYLPRCEGKKADERIDPLLQIKQHMPLWQIKLMAIVRQLSTLPGDDLIRAISAAKNPHNLLIGFGKNSQGIEKTIAEGLKECRALDAYMDVLKTYTSFCIEETKAALIKSLTLDQKAMGLERAIVSQELKSLLDENSGLNADQRQLVASMNASVADFIGKQGAFAVIIEADKAEKANNAQQSKKAQ